MNRETIIENLLETNHDIQIQFNTFLYFKVDHSLQMEELKSCHLSLMEEPFGLELEFDEEESLDDGVGIIRDREWLVSYFECNLENVVNISQNSRPSKSKLLKTCAQIYSQFYGQKNRMCKAN
jgi:hypothetical protein